MPAATPLETLVDRAGALYSLPTVAMEVVRLAGEENVDTQRLKETIEGDPALCAKILRVVNSSMFGLSGEVGNLTQALALLGVRPLKLLVLGFSLPDELFVGMATDALRRYWTTALTRAASAREIANTWFAAGEVNGDDAFVAGLLRDLGQLVLIQQMAEPYLKFLEATHQNEPPLTPRERRQLERDTLGFDRVALTAELMTNWNLPVALVDAVRYDASSGPTGNRLGEVLALAELVTELVGEHRLGALPELLEQGDAACGLTRPMVNELIGLLDARVQALAEAIDVELTEDRDYAQVLFDAHAQLSLVAESAVASALSGDDAEDELGEALLAESHELRLSMRAFLRGDSAGERVLTRTEAAHAPGVDPPPPELNDAARRRLEEAVQKLASRCRDERQELSLALASVDGLPLDPNDRQAQRRFELSMQHASDGLESGRAARLTLDESLVAIAMPGVDRRAAIGFCQRLAEAIASRAEEEEEMPVLHAGLASISIVPVAFDAPRLIQGAERCLAGARTAARGGVKSIEVF